MKRREEKEKRKRREREEKEKRKRRELFLGFEARCWLVGCSLGRPSKYMLPIGMKGV